MPNLTYETLPAGTWVPRCLSPIWQTATIDGLGVNHVEYTVASVMITRTPQSARRCDPYTHGLIHVTVVVCPSPDDQKPLRGAHWPALRVGVHAEVAVHTNPRVCSSIRRHRSNGITQQVEHPPGSRAAQRSGALGLSSAEVTMLMRLNADTREIITLSLAGEPHTHQPRCVEISIGVITLGTLQDKTIRGILVDAQSNPRHSSMEPNTVS